MFLLASPLLGFSSPSIQGIFPRMLSLMNILLSVSSDRSSSFLLLKSFHQDCARLAQHRWPKMVSTDGPIRYVRELASREADTLVRSPIRGHQ